MNRDLAMRIPKAFWASQLQGNIVDKFRSFLSDERFDMSSTENKKIYDEYPILLASAKVETVAESQMFFDEPWCNIEYADRAGEVTRLYNECCNAITLVLDTEGVDMDKFFKLNRQTMYDDFPDAWDSSVAYELGERVHLWVETEHTWFLGEFQEDKELPIEIRFGRFNADDMAKLVKHMSAFSAR